MVAALVVNVVLICGVLALLLWPVLENPRLFGLLFFFLCFAAIGARASVRRTRRRGREAAGADLDRMEGLTQRLCLLADLPVPKVEVEADRLPLTWTVAVPWAAPRLHTTTGLLDVLPERELEAVIAHELSHLANRDATVMTLLAAPSTWVLRGVRQMWADRERDFRNILAIVYFGSYSVPLASLLLVSSRMVSRERELAADRGAAVLTGSPSALASALLRLTHELSRSRRRDLRTVAARDPFHLLPARRAEPRGARRLWATHPRLEVRVRHLEHLEAQAHRRLRAPDSGRRRGTAGSGRHRRGGAIIAFSAAPRAVLSCS